MPAICRLALWSRSFFRIGQKRFWYFLQTVSVGRKVSVSCIIPGAISSGGGSSGAKSGC